MKKIDLAKSIIEKNIELFRCPICKSQMNIKEKSLLCFKKHCFDLSKNGYIHLLVNPAHSKYDKEMLTARNTICQSGFFRKMMEKISNIILREIDEKNLFRVRMVDAGCGEGSNLDSILKYLRNHSKGDYIGVGLDISREGIYIAAGTYPGNIWCVGDLADSPFQDKQFDIIINILSPANYTEFSRILTNQGLLIKVIPGHHYLQEIRKAFYQQKERQNDSYDHVIDLFQKHFTVLSREHLLYKQKIDKKYIVPLIQMTPLSWSIPKEDFQQKDYLQIQNVTVDLTIIAGREEKNNKSVRQSHPLAPGYFILNLI